MIWSNVQVGWKCTVCWDFGFSYIQLRSLGECSRFVGNGSKDNPDCDVWSVPPSSCRPWTLHIVHMQAPHEDRQEILSQLKAQVLWAPPMSFGATPEFWRPIPEWIRWKRRVDGTNTERQIRVWEDELRLSRSVCQLVSVFLLLSIDGLTTATSQILLYQQKK